MATAGTSGLGRRKKAPGLMDQIGKFFGGDKKKRGKVSSPRPKSRFFTIEAFYTTREMLNICKHIYYTLYRQRFVDI
ncbi:myelin basic protein isoform X3 [Silurus asotus]|uniref:Myelin basic protein isoform X3 n=1 Tax=Silurus asotus TaxID=30991 RepID=A0AAD5AIH1_SILAS|nr:myelin basic protein isoform X3 [Silurus asotus]